MQDFQSSAKKDLEQITTRCAGDIMLLHSARATPALVEDIFVIAYNQKMPLKQVASLSTPDARTIMVQPWDAGLLPDIRKAIESSSLGMGIVPDEKGIRLTLPQLSEERRLEILKALGKKVEEVRIAIRRVRDHALKTIEEAFRANEISEDQKFRFKNELQKLIDMYVNRINDMEAKKSEEIRQV